MPPRKSEQPVRWRIVYHHCVSAFPPVWDDMRVVRPVYANGALGPCTVQIQTLTGEWVRPRSHEWRRTALKLARALERERFPYDDKEEDG